VGDDGAPGGECRHEPHKFVQLSTFPVLRQTLLKGGAVPRILSQSLVSLLRHGQLQKSLPSKKSVLGWELAELIEHGPQLPEVEATLLIRK